MITTGLLLKDNKMFQDMHKFRLRNFIYCSIEALKWPVSGKTILFPDRILPLHFAYFRMYYADV